MLGRSHNETALVTGGASFIGSHLVEALVARGATVTVADDLSSGRIENLEPLLSEGRIRFLQADLRAEDAARTAVAGCDTVYHLAADHGGRGYIDTHEAAIASNLMLDSMVFRACVEAGVARVIYASSGCVYPLNLQHDPGAIVRLREEDIGPPYEPDGIYGWAKLTGEKVLAAYAAEHGIKAASCRYFTVYGPRGCENHAVIAMIARAFTKQDPFEVWGTGEQLRNWTYVSDIVEGTLAVAELADTNAEAFNIGTMEGTRVIDAVRMVLERSGHEPDIVTRPDMPTGPYYRIAENGKLRERAGWSPKVSFADGLAMTMDWYFANHSADDIGRRLPELLLER